MQVKRLGDPSKWEVHCQPPVVEEYATEMDQPTAQAYLEEWIGIPASHARRVIRLAKMQGPTLVTDGVVIIPPRG